MLPRQPRPTRKCCGGRSGAFSRRHVVHNAPKHAVLSMGNARCGKTGLFYRRGTMPSVTTYRIWKQNIVKHGASSTLTASMHFFLIFSQIYDKSGPEGSEFPPARICLFGDDDCGSENNRSPSSGYCLQLQTWANACSKSARISRMFSVPMDKRTVLGRIPCSSSSALES